MNVPWWLKLLGWSIVLAPALGVLAGQAGLLGGVAPKDLGVRDGRLKPPARTPNSVSSQARLHAGHPFALQAQIEPIRYQGDAQAAMQRLAGVLVRWPRTTLVLEQPGYLRAECRTRWLRFTDDLEFLLDEPAKVIHVRSASRLGRKDFGVNRQRVEAIRARFEQA